MTYVNVSYEKRKEIRNRIAELAVRDQELADLLEMVIDVIDEYIAHPIITIDPAPMHSAPYVGDLPSQDVPPATHGWFHPISTTTTTNILPTGTTTYWGGNTQNLTFTYGTNPAIPPTLGYDEDEDEGSPGVEA